MKRRDLLRHLEKHGYVNRRAQKWSSIPRHREIIDFLARKICKDLDIPEP